MPAEIRRQRMSLDEYHLLPLHPGWKVEYLAGEAVFWPRESCAYGTRPVAPLVSPAPAGVTVRPLEAADAPAFTELFVTVFDDTPEYAGWPADRFRTEAEKIVREFFAGKRGAGLAASHLAVRETNVRDDGAILGAAFVVARPDDAALLDVLLVAPGWHRRGAHRTRRGAAHPAHLPLASRE